MSGRVVGLEPVVLDLGLVFLTDDLTVRDELVQDRTWVRSVKTPFEIAQGKLRTRAVNSSAARTSEHVGELGLRHGVEHPWARARCRMGLVLVQRQGRRPLPGIPHGRSVPSKRRGVEPDGPLAAIDVAGL